MRSAELAVSRLVARCLRSAVRRRVARRLASDERGGVAILVALGLLAFVAAAALAIDAGQLYVVRNELQTAAAAGAMAAVNKLGDAKAVTAEAVGYVARNLPSGATGEGGTPLPAAQVTVEQGVWDGVARSFAATDDGPNAVRVTARRARASGNAVGLLFARVFGRDDAEVSASAIAVRARGSYCLVAVEKAAKDAFLMRSNARASLVNCSTYVASSGARPALRTEGAAMLKVDASQQICAHSYAGSGYSKTPRDNCPPPDNLDPLSGKAKPTPTACAAANTNVTYKASAILSPGTYCGRLTVNSNVTITLRPGVYVLRGARLEVRSNSLVRVEPGGSGVLIYLVYDAAQLGESSIAVSSNSVLDLWAQPMRPYAGVLLYQEQDTRNGIRTQLFNSNATGRLRGTIYLPDSPVVLDSNGETDGDVIAECGLWVARTYLFKSNARLSLDRGNATSCGFDPFGASGGARAAQLVG